MRFEFVRSGIYRIVFSFFLSYALTLLLLLTNIPSVCSNTLAAPYAAAAAGVC